LKLENSKWEEACFNEEHVAVLTEWATGGQVDLQEAFSYHRSQPSEKSAYHKLKMGQEEGMVYLQPRGGVALLDEHIALLQTLEQEGGSRFTSVTFVKVLPKSIKRAFTFPDPFPDQQSPLQVELLADRPCYIPSP
jgi:glutamate mutase epsilon subunit